MKVLLLGGHGLLGSAFRVTAPAGVVIAAPRRVQVDITEPRSVAHAIESAEPDWIINCAAYTAVDAAETEPEAAMRANATAVGTIAVAAAARGARVLQPSTDYVFDGPREIPWTETDTPSPKSVYARSKRDGEEKLLASGADGLVVRIGWLFGDGGKNFPATMWTRAQAKQHSKVVSDQIGAPTFAPEVASWCWALIERDARGIFHASSAGAASWYAVAQRVYARAGWPDGVTPTTSAEFASPAPRPSFSVLDCSKLDRTLGIVRRSWSESLDAYLNILASRSAA